MVATINNNVTADGEKLSPEDGWKERHRERVVDDFSYFREGDPEPTLGKIIKFLIFHEKAYIVYLDEDYFVEWSVNSHYGNYPADLGKVTNRVGHLETLSMSLLSRGHWLPFRRLLGESLARALSERDATNALVILDDAEKYMTARSRERARTWYLSSSSLVTMIVLLIVVLSWLNKGMVTNRIGRTAFEILLGAGVGSLGALLSIINRSNDISMDASAGWKVHYLESAARIVVGVAGACLIALAIKANMFLGNINLLNSLSVLLVVCIIAGASERLVPNLIRQVEGNSSFDQAKHN